MSFSDFGEEQLTQPSLDIAERPGYNALDFLDLFHELSCSISELSPGMACEPVTIYLGGDATAVFQDFALRSVDGLRVFCATPSEAALVARVAGNLQADYELRLQLAATTLQDTIDALPQVKKRLAADAASIAPIYSCPALKVIIPRWEIPYAINIHDLAFEGHNDSTLRWASQFLVFYLFTITTEPSSVSILESSVQQHIRASYPQEKRYVPRFILDQVNRKCKERFDLEPILFEG